MADLIFKCPACGSRLAVEASRYGETVTCTSCGGGVPVPRAAVQFACTQCQAELAAPLALVKSTISCPGCAAELTVPTKSTRTPVVRPASAESAALRKPAKTTLTAQEPDDTPPASQPVGTAAQATQIGQPCRACGYPMASGAIVCPHCNINQRTGRKNHFRRPVWLTGRRFLAALPSGALLILLVIGGRYGWHHYREMRQAKQEAVAQEARDKVVSASIGRLRAAAGPGMPVLTALLQTLDELQRHPADGFHNRRLAEYVQFLGEDSIGRDVRPGLMLIRGLNQLVTSDLRSGLQTCADVRAGGGETPFAALVDTNAVFMICPKCGGSGAYRSPDQLIMGGPASACGTCHGSGKAIDRAAVGTRYNAALDRTLELLAAVPASGMDLILLKPQASPAELRRRWCETGRLNLVDTLLRFSQKHPELRLALDPDVLPLLVRTPPPAPLVLATITNAATLGTVLHGAQSALIVRSSPISETDSNLVALVTTEPLWTYAFACRQLAQQQPARAYTALHEATLDDSVFGRRARRLQQVVLETHSNAVEQAKWEKQVGSSLIRQADVRRAAGDAVQALRRAGAPVAAALATNLDADVDAGLTTECAWMLGTVLEQDAVVRGLEAKLAGGARAPAGDEAALPDSWRTRLERLNAAAALSLRMVNDAHFESATNDEQVAHNLAVSTAAFALDRGNLLARAALGYWRVRQAVLLGGGSGSKTNAPAELAQACRETHRVGLLRAAQTLAGQSFATADNAPRKVGVAGWLAIDQGSGQGAALTLNARFTGGAGPVAVKYDGTLGPVWQSAGRDAAAWLARFSAGRVTNQTLQVTVASAAASANADSAVLALAIGSVSALRNTPLRSDLLLTGALRTNGMLQAVFSADTRVAAALASPGVELVVVPSANEPDLMLLGPETLCRCTVVLADDVTTALRYAMGPAYQRGALEKLHRAQALILAGDWEKAQPLLLEAASEAPELLNARRLLQWQACWRRTGSSNR